MTQVLVNSLIVDPRYYPRKDVDQAHVDEIADLMKDGVSFDAIKITAHNIVVDGVHRVKAAQKLGRPTIEAEIIVCDSILLEANRLNGKHGKGTTMKEKEDNAVRIWKENPGIKLQRIADALGVSLRFVLKWTQGVREEAKAQRDARLRERIQAGVKVREAALEEHTSRSTAHRASKKEKPSVDALSQNGIRAEMGQEEFPTQGERNLFKGLYSGWHERLEEVAAKFLRDRNVNRDDPKWGKWIEEMVFYLTLAFAVYSLDGSEMKCPLDGELKVQFGCNLDIQDALEIFRKRVFAEEGSLKDETKYLRYTHVPLSPPQHQTAATDQQAAADATADASAQGLQGGSGTA